MQDLLCVDGIRGEMETGLEVVDRLGSAALRPQRLRGEIPEFLSPQRHGVHRGIVLLRSEPHEVEGAVILSPLSARRSRRTAVG